MNSVKNILIVCFDFPPNDGIGGRRWSKIAQELVRKGMHLHVIKSSPKDPNKKTNWIDLSSISNSLTIHEFDRNYPISLLKDVTTIRDKVRYRYDLATLKLKHKGTPFDQAINWGKEFQDKIRYLISEKGVDKIFVTGAPFNLMYLTCQIKSEFPSVKVLCDYRDPWLTGVYYGMASLAPKRYKEEQSKQDYVFDHADFITCPNPIMLGEIRGSGKKVSAEKFRVIPHFFEDDLVRKIKASTMVKDSSDKIRIIYGGAIYLGVEKYLVELNKSLSELKGVDPSFYNRLQIDFYSSDNRSDLFEANAQIVQFKPFIGDRLFDEIIKSDFILILYAQHNCNYMTTKFIENLPFENLTYILVQKVWCLIILLKTT